MALAFRFRSFKRFKLSPLRSEGGGGTRTDRNGPEQTGSNVESPLWNKLKRKIILSESQGQNLALTVLYLQLSLNSGRPFPSGPQHPDDTSSSSSLVLSSLELSDTKVCEPCIRAPMIRTAVIQQRSMIWNAVIRFIKSSGRPSFSHVQTARI